MNELVNNISNLKSSISKVDYTPKNNEQYGMLAVVALTFLAFKVIEKLATPNDKA